MSIFYIDYSIGETAFGVTIPSHTMTDAVTILTAYLRGRHDAAGEDAVVHRVATRPSKGVKYRSLL